MARPKRDKPNPASWAQMTPEEVAQREAEEAERERAAVALAQQQAEQAAEREALWAEREADVAARLHGAVRERIELRPGAAVTVCTTDTVPGREIVEVIGEIHAVVVNSRGPFSDTAAKVRTAVGGEVKSYGKLMVQTRAEAVARLKDVAHAEGADAVIAMRFDTNAITDEMVEVAAYGTAVVTT